jgi:hypothetical protein
VFGEPPLLDAEDVVEHGWPLMKRALSLSEHELPRRRRFDVPA